jgi:hypothetical protein
MDRTLSFPFLCTIPFFEPSHVSTTGKGLEFTWPSWAGPNSALCTPGLQKTSISKHVHSHLLSCLLQGGCRCGYIKNPPRSAKKYHLGSQSLLGGFDMLLWHPLSPMMLCTKGPPPPWLTIFLAARLEGPQASYSSLLEGSNGATVFSSSSPQNPVIITLGDLVPKTQRSDSSLPPTGEGKPSCLSILFSILWVESFDQQGHMTLFLP